MLEEDDLPLKQAIIDMLPHLTLPGIIKWSQGVQASAASHAERGGGTGGNESRREGGTWRVGGENVCHETANKAAPRTKDTPLKTGHNPKSQNKWLVIFLGPPEKMWMVDAKMEDTCREDVFPTQKNVAAGHTSTLRPGHKSIMVPVDAVGGFLVGRSLPRWRTGSIEKGQKQGGVYAGLGLPQQVAVQCTRPAPEGRVRGPRLSR